METLFLRGNYSQRLGSKNRLQFPKRWLERATNKGLSIDEFWLRASNKGRILELSGSLIQTPDNINAMNFWQSNCNYKTEKHYVLDLNGVFQLSAQHKEHLKISRGDSIVILGNIDLFHIQTKEKWEQMNRVYNSPKGQNYLRNHPLPFNF